MRKAYGAFTRAHFNIKGKDLYVTGTCRGYLENQGIGPYIFWGASGTDNNVVEIPDEWTIRHITCNDKEYIEKEKYPNIVAALEVKFFDEGEQNDIIEWEEYSEEAD